MRLPRMPLPGHARVSSVNPPHLLQAHVLQDQRFALVIIDPLLVEEGRLLAIGVGSCCRPRRFGGCRCGECQAELRVGGSW